MAVSPDQATKNWVEAMQGVRSKVEAGVNAVTVAPGQKAADAADFWQDQVGSDKAKRKFKARVAAVSLGDWRASILGKGVSRIAAGATQAQPKMARHMAKFIPHVQAIAERVRAMPKSTLDDRINRMVAQVRGNAEFSST